MDDEKLISLVQENDILYNKFNKNYRMPDKKRAVWSQVSKEMDVPEENCIKRWTSLRDRFAKEKKAEKLASGSGATFTHRWHLMSQLEFLAPHVVPRQVRSTMNIVEQTPSTSTKDIIPESLIIDESFLDMEIQEHSFEPSAMSSTPTQKVESVCETSRVKKKTKRKEVFDNTDEIFIEAVETFKKFCKSREEKTQQRESDPNYAFGKMITATLNTLSGTKQIKAMNLITQVLMQVKLEPE